MIGTQGRISLPPPTRTSGPANFTPKYSQKNHFEHNAGGYNGASASPSENSPRNIQVRTFRMILKYWIVFGLVLKRIHMICIISLCLEFVTGGLMV